MNLRNKLNHIDILFFYTSVPISITADFDQKFMNRKELSSILVKSFHYNNNATHHLDQQIYQNNFFNIFFI